MRRTKTEEAVSPSAEQEKEEPILDWHFHRDKIGLMKAQERLRTFSAQEQAFINEVVRVVVVGQYPKGKLPFSELCREMLFRPGDTFAEIVFERHKSTKKFLSGIGITLTGVKQAKKGHDTKLKK
jgi:hypothetical protein